jgi:pimeloyl-ACP methyl ester carboxylesterase
MNFLEANGLRFALLEEGQGPLVLLLHGFPDTAHTWDLVRPLIAQKGYRAVSPFLRGYHPSGIPERDTDLRTLGQDVLALIGALGQERAIVVAHDWGAAAAYAAAALGPERISRLVTVAIPHIAALRPSLSKLWGLRHFFAYKLRGAPARFARDDFAALPKIYRRWSPRWNPPAEEFAAIRECFLEGASLNAAFGYYRAQSFRRQRWLERLLPMPAVVFCGLDDPVVTPDDYRFAKKMFSGEYTIEEMPGGHFLHREHPDEFARRLLAHL